MSKGNGKGGNVAATNNLAPGGPPPAKGTGSFQPARRCYHDHPPYEIAPGLTIYGGSGNYPAVTDAEIYIGFDHGMDKAWRDRMPWEPGTGVFFPINDMGVPASLDDFKQLIEWTAEQLKAGKKVHAGCIGGHGRTGLFFAALRKLLVPEDDDAIMHVRNNYCKKTVESVQQVDWLHEHFGIKKAEATKGGGYVGGKAVKGMHPPPGFFTGANAGTGASGARTTGKPTNAPASIWGRLLASVSG